MSVYTYDDKIAFDCMLKRYPCFRLGFYVSFELQLLIGSSTEMHEQTSRSCLKMRDHMWGHDVIVNVS